MILSLKQRVGYGLLFIVGLVLVILAIIGPDLLPTLTPTATPTDTATPTPTDIPISPVSPTPRATLSTSTQTPSVTPEKPESNPHPPTPVVHSISPTNTIKGASVPAVVYGENFARSHTLAIGDVACNSTCTNYTTISTTIPITLEVGEHSVIVQDSTGGGESSVVFMVKEPPTPTSPAATPTPALIYPAPVLRRVDRTTAGYELGWDFDDQGRQFEENEWFAVRVYPQGQPEKSVTWEKGTMYHVALYGEPAGKYCWRVFVLRGTADKWVQLSPKSDEWCFDAVWPSEPVQKKSTPTPVSCPPNC